MSFLNKYIKKYGLIFIIGILFLTIEALSDLLQPTIMARIIDIGVKGKNGTYVIHQGILMLGVACVGGLCAALRAVIASHVSQRIGRELRLDLFKKIQTFSFANKDEFDEASLITRLTSDVTQVQNFINGLMRIFVKAPILCIGSVVMTVLLSPKMAVVLLVIIPIIIILIILNLKISYPYFVKIQNALDRVNTVIREYLAGVRVVKAFNRADYEEKRFEKENAHLGEINMRASYTLALFSPMIQFTVHLGIVAVLWFSGFAIKNASIEVGEVMAFTNYMTQILFALSMITHVFMSFVRAKASAERMAVVFEQDSEIALYGLTEKGNDAFETSNEKGTVSFENVTFSYSQRLEDAVLKNISFKCSAGETIGIIGPTGSGKSTLVNLIPGFYYPTSGMIKVDGIDIRTVDSKRLRKRIAIVPQKTMLFTGSIQDNIKWGKEHATLDEIKEVALVSEAHEFITAFPEGYATYLGQGGINLSGGQKQRIAVARALVKKPEILILDDAASAIDLVTEGRMREGLKNYMKNLTTFIIAQRITSVISADRIIVLEAGEIVGIGKHYELLRTCVAYKDIYRSQLGKEEI